MGEKIGRVIYASETIQNFKNPTVHIVTLNVALFSDSAVYLLYNVIKSSMVSIKIALVQFFFLMKTAKVLNDQKEESSFQNNNYSKLLERSYQPTGSTNHL